MYNRPLRLTVANTEQFALPLRALTILALLAAVLSPRPVFMTCFVIFLYGAGWLARILCISNVNDLELNTVIYPDGDLRLEYAGKDAIRARLEGQQWCISSLAVLRISRGKKTQRLVILSAQQNQKNEDFRRLNMWLRQDFYNDARVTRVLDS
jgi:hypothetical protein